MEDDRTYGVATLIHEHLKSPSLRHIRDGYAVGKLAQRIVAQFDRDTALWKKWDGPREILLKAASACWIPIADLRDYLNGMGGARLTTTDVEQRLRALWEDPYLAYPNENLRESCLSIYVREKAEGTELPAIVGALQEHVELEEERLRREHQELYRRQQEEARLALEQRLLSGADCKWTPLRRSKELYCRINGRAYRLTPAADKKWKLCRVESVEDSSGILVGTYGTRRDATRALERIAYEPEPRH